jgi:hypothetical protein
VTFNENLTKLRHFTYGKTHNSIILSGKKISVFEQNFPKIVSLFLLRFQPGASKTIRLKLSSKNLKPENEKFLNESKKSFVGYKIFGQTTDGTWQIFCLFWYAQQQCFCFDFFDIVVLVLLTKQQQQ